MTCKILLICGIVSSLLYVAMNVFVPMPITTMVILLACGALTVPDAPNIQANLPTPWVGVWERINIGVFLLWVVVLATTLLRARDTAAVTGRQDACAA